MTLLRALAQLVFKGCHEIKHTDFHRFFIKHHVSAEAYAKLRKSWKASLDHCYAWEFDVPRWYNVPLYFAYGNESPAVLAGSLKVFL